MANRIREIRKSKGMTLFQLAEKLGVSESTVQRYESGNIRNLKYETMTDLAIIFDCSPSYVMGWENPTETNIHIDIKITDDEIERIKRERNLNNDGLKELNQYIDFLLTKAEYKERKGMK